MDLKFPHINTATSPKCSEHGVRFKLYAAYKIKPCRNFILCLAVPILSFFSNSILAQTTLSPTDDAYVRNGSFSTVNYGTDANLLIKGSSTNGYTRISYLKFSLSGISNVATATLRMYGRNTENTSAINISAFETDDSWTEGAITFNNAPSLSGSALSSVNVNNVAQYYELDVTELVKAEVAGDKVVSFLIKNSTNQNRNLTFNSRENTQNKPQLVITTLAGGGSPSNALLFVENPDKFPSNERFTFSRVQIPWNGADDVAFNSNRDSVKVRIHNKGIGTLTISNFTLSNTARWKIDKLNGVTYNAASAFPLNISSGNFVDLMVKFIAKDQATRVKVVHDTFTIASNDSKFPLKKVFFDGLWQKSAEGNHEPYGQEILNAFGFKTTTGFGRNDPDVGDSTKLKGSEIKPSYFVRANTSIPISVTQIASYRGCCSSTQKIFWYLKGSTSKSTLFMISGTEAQTVLPRNSSGSGLVASGTITTNSIFGFKVGSNSTDAAINYQHKIGIRVWKALDSKGYIIPNSYIIANDFLSDSSNYDYQDNVYFVSNVKPYIGTGFNSALNPNPSALDFEEKLLQSNNTLQLNLSSGGKSYSDGSKDPPIVISSVSITGENKSEFSASMPVKTTLNPQENTSLTVTFKPVSQGLKIADLLIFYNNSQSPLRVPLYGIAKSSGTTVTVHQRINSGASSSLTVNGKTWNADQYAYDNLEPSSNTTLSGKIAGTDDDVLYITEQSSNGEKLPFRYEMPMSNGDYVVRLHFAEIIWGAPGSGFKKGGPGSRVMSVELENQLRLINLDVAQEVGEATAVIKNLPITVTDGKLDINFSASVNRPMVSAIEVYSFSTSLTRSVNNTDSSAISVIRNPLNESNFEKPKLYPNPLNDRFTLEFPNQYEGRYSLEIIDLVGRKYGVGNPVLRHGGSTLDINISKLQLKPGVYSMRIYSDSGKTEVIKLVIR